MYDIRLERISVEFECKDGVLLGFVPDWDKDNFHGYLSPILIYAPITYKDVSNISYKVTLMEISKAKMI